MPLTCLSIRKSHSPVCAIANTRHRAYVHAMSLPVTEPSACRHLKDELCQAVINNCGMLYVLMRCRNCGVKSAFQVDRDGRIEKVYALGHVPIQ